MKILVLSDYYPPNTKGGADIAAERLSSELARRGNLIRVLTTVQNKADVGTTTVRGVQVRRVHSRYPLRLRSYAAVYNPAVASRVATEIADFGPDLIHAQNIHTHISFQALLEGKAETYTLAVRNLLKAVEERRKDAQSPARKLWRRLI